MSMIRHEYIAIHMHTVAPDRFRGKATHIFIDFSVIQYPRPIHRAERQEIRRGRIKDTI